VKKPNLFLLTGSTTPGNESSLIHTGAGRIVKLKMYTLTLQEKSLTTNKIHFNDLFENKIQTSTNDKDIKFYLDEICKGDRPRLIDNTVEECIELNTDYVNSIVSANDRKNITNSTLQKILKELARNICTELNISSIAKNTNLSRETVTTYLDYLTDSNIIEFFYC
jgi:predicted AAA+ superfamily ATPase